MAQLVRNKSTQHSFYETSKYTNTTRQLIARRITKSTFFVGTNFRTTTRQCLSTEFTASRIEEMHSRLKENTLSNKVSNNGVSFAMSS